jgi:hypothetical protein
MSGEDRGSHLPGRGLLQLWNLPRTKTGAFYRVDLDRIFRGKIDLQAELQKASSESEGGVALELVPDGMSCPRCGEPIGLSEVTLSSMPPPAESFVEAVLL